MELKYSAVHAKPREIDWQFPGERVEFYEANRCDECGVVTTNADCPRCGASISAGEGPVINYFYPLPGFNFDGDPDSAAEKIVDLPLCVVHLLDTNEFGLALVAGGMDLSWEIARAYMLLGYYPPLHFCRLPDCAGLPEWAHEVAEACLYTIASVEAEMVAMRLEIQRLME